VSIFLFAMGSLVMGGNLLLLYLGWEGVGLASYLLIGYYFTKPSAVAAAKKAFIVNRIGDLGLALGIFLIWVNYGTIEYDGLFQALSAGSVGVTGESLTSAWAKEAIPFCLMLGAFGKSAQLPLYVWLPDAMEGPTPVSALIHAATMVTAGVYLIARMYPFFELHPLAFTTVAWVGCLTALFAATIGMAQYDIKRVMAYSTISQLGYMFLGLGVGTSRHFSSSAVAPSCTGWRASLTSVNCPVFEMSRASGSSVGPSSSDACASPGSHLLLDSSQRTRSSRKPLAARIRHSTSWVGWRSSPRFLRPITRFACGSVSAVVR
jgi:NADH:ubiquinone oxidoreductase subunit 5 (subunit L)/multisubunit Na+/H+ antiporter MnhA subunit